MLCATPCTITTTCSIRHMNSFFHKAPPHMKAPHHTPHHTVTASPSPAVAVLPSPSPGTLHNTTCATIAMNACNKQHDACTTAPAVCWHVTDARWSSTFNKLADQLDITTRQQCCQLCHATAGCTCWHWDYGNEYCSVFESCSAVTIDAGETVAGRGMCLARIDRLRGC